MLTCSANLIIFFYAPYSALDIAVSKLPIYCNRWVWIDFQVLVASLSNPWICDLKDYKTEITCPINEILSFNFGSLLSIIFKLFIWATKSATFVVEVLKDLID